MNLHALVAPRIAAVNPFIIGTLKQSIGYTTNANFVQAPNYLTFDNQRFQVQALTAKDLRQLDSLNIQGSTRAVYFYGDVEGTVRQAMKGGDLVIFNGSTWLVTAVLEVWDADGPWSKCAITLQNGA